MEHRRDQGVGASVCEKEWCAVKKARKRKKEKGERLVRFHVLETREKGVREREWCAARRKQRDSERDKAWERE